MDYDIYYYLWHLNVNCGTTDLWNYGITELRSYVIRE